VAVLTGLASGQIPCHHYGPAEVGGTRRPGLEVVLRTDHRRSFSKEYDVPSTAGERAQSIHDRDGQKVCMRHQHCPVAITALIDKRPGFGLQ